MFFFLCRLHAYPLTLKHCFDFCSATELINTTVRVKRQNCAAFLTQHVFLTIYWIMDPIYKALHLIIAILKQKYISLMFLENIELFFISSKLILRS